MFPPARLLQPIVDPSTLPVQRKRRVPSCLSWPWSLPRTLPLPPSPLPIAICMSCSWFADLSCVSDSFCGRRPMFASRARFFLLERKFAALPSTSFADRVLVRPSTGIPARLPGSLLCILIWLPWSSGSSASIPWPRQSFCLVFSASSVPQPASPSTLWAAEHLALKSDSSRRGSGHSAPFFSAGRFPGFGTLPPAPFFLRRPSSSPSM